MALKEKIDNALDGPGVYIFKDKDARPIYIGKAVSIRKRLRSHFARDHSAREDALYKNTADLDYIPTADESTALLLEAALIKKYNPRYNVALRDDKSYPRLKLTLNEEYPRLFITRRLKPDGAVYFGPYTSTKLLRKAVAFTKRLFPLRTCKNLPKKECLNFHLGQCLAPCVDREKKRQYNKVVEELRLFLEGEQEKLLNNLADEMKAASENKDYENAARIRDRIRAFSLLTSKAAESAQETAADFRKPYHYPIQQIEQLRAILNLPKTPHIIEAFDVSNISGKEAVGSMVSFKDGQPDKSQYRRFKIKTVTTIDDYSMMGEIVLRRYSRLLREKGRLPDLIIIDGGKGHLAAAKRQLRRQKILTVPVISIAKRLDKIYVSEDKEPLLLGKFEGALLFVQRIRDEAHRFAIEYHRSLRRKKLGISKPHNFKKASVVSEKEAKRIYDYFHK
jgi:excinuclease ABC subunit C